MSEPDAFQRKRSWPERGEEKHGTPGIRRRCPLQAPPKPAVFVFSPVPLAPAVPVPAPPAPLAVVAAAAAAVVAAAAAAAAAVAAMADGGQRKIILRFAASAFRRLDRTQMFGEATTISIHDALLTKPEGVTGHLLASCL
ncbi:hypothetical protein HZH68_010418 [Vespula germanica]|uniref:Uncharacterized protein n=1 Tax=Vespula germanica TaxID=30212 RepID=A0A834JVA1_VESGE|nr:hypothetical protein HZH68_010418 [Vespula germanica]